MAKGLGVNQQSNQKASNVVKDGNKGWAPSVGATKKIKSRISIAATPTIPNK